MSVQLLEKLTSLGKDLGYAGLELREWVSAQVKIEEKKSAEALEREERRLQKEKHQKEIAAKAQEDIRIRAEAKAISEAERNDKLKREEAERNEKLKREELALEQAKLDQARAKLELEERLKRLELKQQKELKLAELQLTEKKPENSNADGHNESNSDDSQVSDASASSSRGNRSKSGPKLPHFDENKDNIDPYLRRFERYAALQGWPEDDWAIYLSALLKGRALEVYSRLTEVEARSYPRLKASLLRKYQLTAEGFRRQFYAARREKDSFTVRV